MASLKKRAFGLLRSSLQRSSDAESDEQSPEKYLGLSFSSNPEPSISEKLPPDEHASLPEKQLSLSSGEKIVSPTTGDLAVIEDIQSQRLVHTIPSQ